MCLVLKDVGAGLPDGRRCAGASSLSSGQLEVMLNRRAQASDELGNPEMLNEAEGCCGAHTRTGLVFAPTSH